MAEDEGRRKMFCLCAGGPPKSAAEINGRTELVVTEEMLKGAGTVGSRIRLEKEIAAHQRVTFQAPIFELDLSQPNSADELGAFLDLTAKYNQWHLFDETWYGSSAEARKAFIDEVVKTKASQHIARFKTIISSRFELSTIEPIKESEMKDLGFCSEEYMALERIGKNVLAKRRVGFILVAGGLGERLGASQIKISLPTDSLTDRSFLETFLLYIRSYSDPQPPLFIMTSEDTHEKTKELLISLNMAFSIDACNDLSHIVLSKQETVPCFLDKEGNLALKASGKLLLKPHGHGDVHPLFRNACLDAWIGANIDYAVFFQDTNPSCFRVIPALIGAAETASADCAVACVPRVPKSATGCIAKNNASQTIENVEYNLMNAYFAEYPDLDPKFYLGNTNQILVRLKPYKDARAEMPEFCNPKFAPGSDTIFSSPARLECLMQDIMRFFPSEKVLPVLFRDASSNATKTHVLYAPAKNSLQVAKRAWQAGTSDGSAASSEAAVYACNCLMLLALGCTVKVDSETQVDFGEGMYIKPLFPSVVFDPMVLPFFADASSMFPEPSNVVIGANSSIEFRGPGKIVCKDLKVSGSLLVWAKTPNTTIVLKGVVVENAGRKVTSVHGDARLRVGHSNDLRTIESDEPGEVVFTA